MGETATIITVGRIRPVGHFVLGVRFYLTGLRLLFRYPSLLAISLIPIGSTVLLLTGIALVLGWKAGALLAYDADGSLRQVITVTVFMVAMVFGYFIYLPVARILLAPFSEALSRRAEWLHCGVRPETVGRGWMSAMMEGVRLVLFQLLVILVTLAVGAIFPPVAIPLGVGVAIVTCSLDFCDIPLAIRGWSLREKLRLLATNPGLSLGFGSAVWLSLLVPGVNILLLPAGVVGATVLVVELEASRRAGGQESEPS